MTQPEEFVDRRFDTPVGELSATTDPVLAVALALARPHLLPNQTLPTVNDAQLRGACLALGLSADAVPSTEVLRDAGVVSQLLGAVSGDDRPLHVVFDSEDEVPVTAHMSLTSGVHCCVDIDDLIPPKFLGRGSRGNPKLPRPEVDVVIGVCGYPRWEHDTALISYSCSASHTDPAATWAFDGLGVLGGTWGLAAAIDCAIRHRRSMAENSADLG